MSRVISNKLRQELINYLALRPYHEVYKFIPALEALPKQIEAHGEETATPAEPQEG